MRPLRDASKAALIAVSVFAGSVLFSVSGAAAAEGGVEVCTDESLCTQLTVKRRDTSQPDPADPPGSLRTCGPMTLRNGIYYQDHCDVLGNRYTIKYGPDDIIPFSQPTTKEITSIARGLLNPPPPRIHTSPRASSGLLVHTPTWLWLSPSYWRTYTRAVALPGLTVTMNATPTHVTWNMGNGDRITCLGPGNPWLGGSGEVGSTCSYTYRHSSARKPGGRYRITATVTFVGTFTSTGLVNTAGPLGIVTRTSFIYTRVAEIQGLVVS